MKETKKVGSFHIQLNEILGIIFFYSKGLVHSLTHTKRTKTKQNKSNMHVRR